MSRGEQSKGVSSNACEGNDAAKFFHGNALSPVDACQRESIRRTRPAPGRDGLRLWSVLLVGMFPGSDGAGVYAGHLSGHLSLTSTPRWPGFPALLKSRCG